MTDAPRKRILVEGSKLADKGMDGIKRYVAELLRAYREPNRQSTTQKTCDDGN